MTLLTELREIHPTSFLRPQRGLAHHGGREQEEGGPFVKSWTKDLFLFPIHSFFIHSYTSLPVAAHVLGTRDISVNQTDESASESDITVIVTIMFYSLYTL